MALITQRDRQTIQQWTARHTSPITVFFSHSEGHAGKKLVQFYDEFKGLAPQVQIRNTQDEPFCAPAMIIGRHENIAYQALPQGKELPPFLEALSMSAHNVAASGDWIAPAAEIELPAELSVFIAQHCPNCPYAVTQLLSLADKNPLLRLTIIDGFLFDEKAEELSIRSVPTLILDNGLRWTGRLDMAEVVRQCVRRDPARLSAASLRQIIEAGEAARVATMMSANDQIFPAFIDLLLHERWPVRLGAMVTAEYLADESPALAARMIAPLWERFADLDAPIQTDVVQVLAQIENEAVKEYLEKIASGDFAGFVKDAAAEELEAWSNG